MSRVQLSEVCQQIVPVSRSSCIEGIVAEVGPTDEKCTSFRRPTDEGTWPKNSSH